MTASAWAIPSRKLLLALFLGVFVVLFARPLKELFAYSLQPENRRYASHIIFIPFVSAYLVFASRKSIAEGLAYPDGYGVPAVLAGIIMFLAGIVYGPAWSRNDYLALMTFSAVVVLMGGCILFFGRNSFRATLFPLMFLLFLVPVPSWLLEKAFLFLQVGSTEVSYSIFQVTGIPIAREGFTFHLPGVSIEIAPQCSGMRATISLLIVSVLAGHLFLRTTWKKAVLAVATVPITLLGNSVRIVGLTFLAMYVDREFINSESLPHLRGGWLFFLLDLLVLWGVMTLLSRTENRRSRMRGGAPSLGEDRG